MALLKDGVVFWKSSDCISIDKSITWCNIWSITFFITQYFCNRQCKLLYFPEYKTWQESFRWSCCVPVLHAACRRGEQSCHGIESLRISTYFLSARWHLNDKHNCRWKNNKYVFISILNSYPYRLGTCSYKRTNFLLITICENLRAFWYFTRS